ncbi:MAG TPA: hypothetical protein VGA22_00600 [Gemmatimonadales bacterium]
MRKKEESVSAGLDPWQCKHVLSRIFRERRLVFFNTAVDLGPAGRDDEYGGSLPTRRPRWLSQL